MVSPVFVNLSSICVLGDVMPLFFGMDRLTFVPFILAFRRPERTIATVTFSDFESFFDFLLGASLLSE